VGEAADRGLRALDLLPHARGAGQLAERRLVGERVVADPVAFGARSLGRRPRAGLGQPAADDEEGGAQVACGQHVEHVRRDGRLRAVVERQRDIRHASPGW
jgi:hypothetical protein